MGPQLDEADAAVVALHGRGATARGILQVVAQLDVDGVAGVAPQATRNTWYPTGFMEPIEQNEPWLSAALSMLEGLVESVEGEGVPAERIVLLGFSQGACLASEFLARNARRYGGHVAFSGGLIGPPGTPRDYEGSLDGTPAFLGCSDRDPHIPEERVHETADVLTELGADVTTRIYEGMGHTVNQDELEAARGVLRRARDAGE
jgi:predicted esterase